jgi:hypothetical protein
MLRSREWRNASGDWEIFEREEIRGKDRCRGAKKTVLPYWEEPPFDIASLKS